MYSGQINYELTTELILMDTLIERKIRLAEDYKFDPMTEGECYVNDDVADILNLEEGDLLYQKFNYYQTLIALVDQYNLQAQNRDKLERDDVV
jgi:hypothetical protein